MSIAPYDLAGFVGAALMIVAYFANQQRWLRSEDWRFPGLNLLGSTLILISLYFDWNFPSVLIELTTISGNGTLWAVRVSLFADV